MASVAACASVVHLRRVVESDAHAFVVLDYVDGGDVEAWLAGRDGGPEGGTPPATATEAEAALLIFELLKVLTACHAAGVVQIGHIALEHDRAGVGNAIE